ncbi:MAG: AraC family transcriptional regulator [Butyrivibrio sp.]|uniref:helix-turn-helix domain-containing protein n=1 Tax=Butyrivibrio sp. TaxID=28121 RepID=UPI0025CE11DF|nr:AraC family transcriptional regulator [Butyrivibrio sp.]MCR5772138.1 AraC family transcriptional regulator [Butyrivibrio sp.]
MIENLNGLQETVNFAPTGRVRLYENDDFEAYPSHWHLPIEIIMPIKNSYRVESCGHVFDIAEDELIFICPGVIHSMPALPGKRMIFQIDISMFQAISGFDHIVSLIYPVYVLNRTNCTCYDQFHSLFIEICQCYTNAGLMAEPEIYTRVAQMLLLLGKNYHLINNSLADTSIKKQREYAEQINRICDYLKLHYSEDISLEEASRIAGFSKYHFSRIFKQLTGVTFYRYINQVRIQKAKIFLMNSDSTITNVAINCGFSSMSSFIRMFRIITGYTPTKFRSLYDRNFETSEDELELNMQLPS